MTKSNYKFMPFYCHDYKLDAGYLKAIEHGAYLLLLFHYWETGKPLPDDDEQLSCITRTTPEEWQNIRPRISKFFKIEDGEWWNKRLEQEIAACKAITLKAKISAEKRWGKSNVVQLAVKRDDGVDF